MAKIKGLRGRTHYLRGEAKALIRMGQKISKQGYNANAIKMRKTLALQARTARNQSKLFG